MFVILIVLDNKRARPSRRAACEENDRGLKFCAIQIQRISVSAYDKVVNIVNSYVRRIMNKCCL